MRDSNGLQYFLTDHLGSVLAVTDASGALISEQRYLPFGEVRTDVGEITQTDFGYTFQRSLPGTGLMDYRARFYSAYLNRFTQPDSIVPEPGNPQSLNRYSYVSNSPVNFNDPTGHDPHWCTDASCRTDYYNSMMGLWRSAHRGDSGGGGNDGSIIKSVVPPGPGSYFYTPSGYISWDPLTFGVSSGLGTIQSIYTGINAATLSTSTLT